MLPRLRQGPHSQGFSRERARGLEVGTRAVCSLLSLQPRAPASSSLRAWLSTVPAPQL